MTENKIDTSKIATLKEREEQLKAEVKKQYKIMQESDTARSEAMRELKEVQEEMLNEVRK